MVGRRRADFDQHKDLIIRLYHEKTPWAKIEEVLLNEHGCRARARTIMRRFKEWDLDFHRVQTKRSDDLNDHIKSYWEDRSTRPKTDEELLQRLLADGFTVTLSAIIQIRKDMNLYRRWDERLGRYRPDSELGKRARRKQKHSALTDAKLAPPPDASDPEDAQSPPQSSHHDVVQQPCSPEAQALQTVGENLGGQRQQLLRGRPPAWPVPQPDQSIAFAHQPDQAMNGSVDPDIASRDAHIQALLDRVNTLERHCLAHGIGLPYASRSPNVPGPGILAAADGGHWETSASFQH
ncbi:hypothetical protein N8I77_009263 [Diaporthe amygdali]|uniref:Clr5 domain-containing protein n=1 Tax=Phomopsis amygdali TaxID=1214568 RepID=A0AAD9S983_PHOAM|nr:hypothetical protein N8I77_009263 [Diaporthe amygdali]